MRLPSASGRPAGWSIGMALAAAYFIVIYRLFRGKVSLDDGGY